MSELLKPGDLIELREGHKVYADVPSHMVFSNRKGDFSLTHHDVRIGGDFSYLAGRYIVTEARTQGGGQGHGPHDTYPDGHRVFCVGIGTGQKVDFYQTGCFTAMIEDIEPIPLTEGDRWSGALSS